MVLWWRMEGTYDRGLLGSLSVAGAQGLPSDGSVVAAVEDVQGVEGDIGLTAVAGTEFGAGCESDSIDHKRSFTAAVADDVDGGAVVDEVLGEGLLGQLESVALDQLLEDGGDFGGVVGGQAGVFVVVVLAFAVAFAFVAVPGVFAVVPAAGALPVVFGCGWDGGCVRGCGGGCGGCGEEGGGDGEDGCGAHAGWCWGLVSLVGSGCCLAQKGHE